MGVPRYQYNPSEVVTVSAQLQFNGLAQPGGFLQASIENPDGVINTLTLHDDGLHQDGQANDGVYASSYADTISQGAYKITVTASGSLSGKNFEREAFTSFWVEQYPDLRLATSDIYFSNQSPLPDENVVIDATIHNIGDTDANNVSILFYARKGESGGERIGEDIINVAAGQQTTASALWNAVPGYHEIYVVISPFSDFLEKAYDNNKAFKVIDILLKGDVNGDGNVDLVDLILGLKMQSTMKLSEEVYVSADVNGDGKIGLEELIYVLQNVSELR